MLYRLLERTQVMSNGIIHYLPSANLTNCTSSLNPEDAVLATDEN